MHWILDVQFDEDKCRVANNHVQQNLNILRKLAINLVKLFKQNAHLKKPLSHIMFDSLLDPANLIKVIHGSGASLNEWKLEKLLKYRKFGEIMSK